jgi:hypothetical protein
MDFSKFETITTIASLLMPGFITVSAFRMIVPSKELIDQRGILSYLTFTGVDYALFYWLIVFVAPINSFHSHPLVLILIWVFVYLLGPFLAGVLLGVVWQNNLARWVFGKIGIRLIHHIPNSWDYMFDSIREPSWILVTLAEGGEVAGYFGTKSFASSDIEERDLFLEQVYKVSENGDWVADDRGKGVWLARERIKLITVWRERPVGSQEDVE